MGNTSRSWVMPTDATRLKAVRLVRKYMRNGHKSTEAHRMTSKDVGYSVASIHQWEKQFPLKRKTKALDVKQTTTTIHSYKNPTKKTTKSTSLNGVVVNHNLNSNPNNKFRVLSVDLMTNDGNIITLTEGLWACSLKNIVKVFG